jgi:hypothetical protein
MLNLSKSASDKIFRFARDGICKLHIITDFDRTLTVGGSSSKGATTWGILGKYLDHKKQKIQHQLYDYYRKLELSGKMTTDEAVCWWEKSLQLFTCKNTV